MTSWQLLRRGLDGRYELFGERPTWRTGRGRRSEIRAAAASVVEDLSAITGSDVRLGVLDGCRVAYVEKGHGSSPLSEFSSAATLPAHASAMGQVLLAFSGAVVVRNAVAGGLDRYTPRTLTTTDRLGRVLKVVRLRQLAVVRGELRPDQASVAAPVFGPDGAIAAALEVCLDDSAEPGVVVAVLTLAARVVSRDLWRPPSVAADGQVGDTRVGRRPPPSALRETFGPLDGDRLNVISCDANG
jgi:DNA-binding IclR family transcriptional regulator